MKTTDEVALLLGRIEKSERVLKQIFAEYDNFLKTDYKTLGRTNTTAIVITEFISSYYTCLETLFLRISQFFENSLQPNRWHADLLEKMTLQINGVRDPVISDGTSDLLKELMRFRHFRRYYFEFKYDWDKLDFLTKKFSGIRLVIHDDLSNFKRFLGSL